MDGELKQITVSLFTYYANTVHYIVCRVSLIVGTLAPVFGTYCMPLPSVVRPECGLRPEMGYGRCSAVQHEIGVPNS